MSLDPKGAALALHRFGLGPRSGAIAALASDPQGALLAELDRPDIGQIVDANLPASGAANRAVYEYNAERNARDRLERKRREAEKTGTEAAAPDKSTEASTATPAEPPPVPCRNKYSSMSPRSGSTPPSTPRSVSSSAWSGSGRTISASVPMPP
jgi:uncharacterized protein (DUF1800 family)